jgi:hypothetical protein
MSPAEGAAELGARHRLLEGWLPLAQEANTRYGWALDGPALEALVLRAAQPLGRARSAFEAYAILWATYTRAPTDEPTP